MFLSVLRLGPGGCYKHFNKIYDNVLGIGIPDLLMNLMSCHGFSKNKYPVVILKFHKGCLNTISQKDSLILIALLLIWENSI